MGKLHRSQRTVSMGNPDALKQMEMFTYCKKKVQKTTDEGKGLRPHLPLSALRLWMWQMLLTVRFTAMSLLSPAM